MDAVITAHTLMDVNAVDDSGPELDTRKNLPISASL
jgi:hypothetical protein